VPRGLVNIACAPQLATDLVAQALVNPRLSLPLVPLAQLLTPNRFGVHTSSR